MQEGSYITNGGLLLVMIICYLFGAVMGFATGFFWGKSKALDAQQPADQKGGR